MGNIGYVLYKKLLKKVRGLTFLQGKAYFSKSREKQTSSIREIVPPSEESPPAGGATSGGGTPAIDSLKCPYCLSTKFVRRGLRQKKYEKVQLYLCKACGKTFTLHITKGKHYPLPSILKGLSLYNLGYSLEESCRIINNSAANSSTSEVKISASTLANWVREFEELCKFSRMREFAIKKYKPEEMVIYATLVHQQLFRYRFHRAKCRLMIEEDFKHRKFWPLKEFLEMVPTECPHQYFSARGGQAIASRHLGRWRGNDLDSSEVDGIFRASEVPMTFSKTQMIVRSKTNYANRLCKFVLQSVKNRRVRHEALQKFMLYNDSVTVATEVPVYLTRDDLLHMQTQLGFEMYAKSLLRGGAPSGDDSSDGGTKRSSSTNSSTVRGVHSDTSEVSPGDLPKLITGHIDILQIRNGQIHILDYKPKAEKGQPIEQLTLYAMALSRLTGLRLFEFKCAWFDEQEYFEFYPLHVLHKPKGRRRRKRVKTIEGTYLINQIKEKIEKLRPI